MISKKEAPTQRHFPLICLTLVSNPELDGGEQQRCYINPYAVLSASRTVAAHSTMKWSFRSLLPWYWNKSIPAGKCVSCTMVHVSVNGGGILHFLVEETPDEVITQRNNVIQQDKIRAGIEEEMGNVPAMPIH